MKKVAYTLKPGATHAVFKGKQVLPGQFLEDDILKFNPAFMKVEFDVQEAVNEVLPASTSTLLTETPDNATITEEGNKKKKKF
jgi:hypothetical protein